MIPPSENTVIPVSNRIGEEEDLESVSPVTVICARLAGRAVIRVIGRCNDAQENNNLDLSDCQLMQVPDAVYHLMRHTEVKGCNLSSNTIKKIPPKFAFNFSHISELNLSHNQMSKLPEELAELSELERLDISHNSFIDIPGSVYRMPKLSYLNASHNCIIELNVERLEECPSIQNVDLEENPLTTPIRNALAKITAFVVTITIPEHETWDEDLNV